MLRYNKNYIILAFNCILNNLKRMISVSGIKKRDRNNNIKKEYMNSICLQMLSLVNILLNSEPYTV